MVPLQGIPYGAKDLLAVKKQPTTWGAKPYAAQVFDYDAHVIERLDKVGAILIAKLSMVELAGGGDYRTAAASLTGPGLNPWDRTRWSGGSSSGPGAAVAAGLVTFAIGSETSGSILTPSAFCGVTGLRPTYGLVSRHGAMALSWTLDKLGPMCRSAEDCALVLHEIAGVDTDDPGSAGRSFNYTPQYTTRRLTEITIGYMPVDFQDGAEPAAQPAFQAAFEVIQVAGREAEGNPASRLSLRRAGGHHHRRRSGLDFRGLHSQRQSRPVGRPAPDRRTEGDAGSAVPPSICARCAYGRW